MNTAHRSIRYHVLVDGEVASAFGQYIQATKRADVISKTWQRWDRIEVVDQWGGRPRIVINRKAA